MYVSRFFRSIRKFKQAGIWIPDQDHRTLQLYIQFLAGFKSVIFCWHAARSAMWPWTELNSTDLCLGKGQENLNDRPIAFLQQSKKLWGWVFSSIWERALRLKLWSFFSACRSSSLITLRNSFQSLLTSPHWKEKIKWQFCFFRVPRISISYRSRYFKREKFVSFWRTETETWALISVKVKKGCNFLPARSLFYCYLHEQALQILTVIDRLIIDRLCYWSHSIGPEYLSQIRGLWSWHLFPLCQVRN